jgi:hypothetical protein
VVRILCISVGLLAWGCSSSSSSKSAPAAETYTVNAKVEAVKGSIWNLRHEAVPTFKDRGGAVVGMDSMVMPFAAPETGSVKVGDLLEVTFEVRWDQKPATRIKSVKALPKDAKLTF